MGDNPRNFFIDKGKTGLANLGATCYLNTAVQCLSYCIDFLRFVLSGRYKKDAELHGKAIHDDSLINELRIILVEMWMNNHSLAPRQFIHAVKRNIDVLEICQQNDINEFLSLFLARLNMDICYDIKIQKSELPKMNNYTNTPFDIQRFKMDSSWLDGVGKEYSEIVDLFYSQSIMQIICGNCSNISHNYEIHTCMMVPLDGKTNTLDECIREYMMEEYLNGSSSSSTVWTCDECKAKAKSRKTLKLWRNPKILIISLKRFTHDLKKNDKHVDIPEVLDLAQYTITKKRCRYKLTSVALHSGSFHGGHYVSICRHPNEKWYMIDDLNVNEYKASTIPDDVGKGYVLFYTCMDP